MQQPNKEADWHNIFYVFWKSKNTKRYCTLISFLYKILYCNNVFK